jgi:hypothetical protein
MASWDAWSFLYRIPPPRNSVRVQGMSLKGLLPLGHLPGCPVSVNPAHCCGAIPGRFRQDVGAHLRLGVVAVNEQCHVAGLVLKFL